MVFDILWLDGLDLRGLPLLERKRLLRQVAPQACLCSMPTTCASAEDLKGIVA
jgi:ATP-dependent DNA ligase